MNNAVRCVERAAEPEIALRNPSSIGPVNPPVPRSSPAVVAHLAVIDPELITVFDNFTFDLRMLVVLGGCASQIKGQVAAKLQVGNTAINLSR